MKKLLVLMMMTGLIHSISHAKEPAEVKPIRDWYQKVGAMIDKGQDIYLSEWVVNKKGADYPAIGKMMGKISFYWTVNPEDSSAHLLKAVIEQDFNEFASYEEYLYGSEGNILFIYHKWRSGGSDLNEFRIYFKNGVPSYITQTYEKTKNVSEYFAIPEIYVADYFMVQRNIKELQAFFKARLF
ncbi:MAG: hypothetical protein HPY53_09735 [Brevinematales bacterium]|nr:hypothetical protein [Brevinematales bacterium]